MASPALPMHLLVKCYQNLVCVLPKVLFENQTLIPDDVYNQNPFDISEAVHFSKHFTKSFLT
jgi:hypothetical protein